MTERKPDWSPIAAYNKHKIEPANGGDYAGIGCSNIARAILYGLTYIGDFIKDTKQSDNNLKTL